MKKKIIILEHNNGKLGNQLWNYASVYAYCLEKGYECQNYSFSYFEYFDFKPDNFLARIKASSLLKKYPFEKIGNFFYKLYISALKKRTRNIIIDSGNALSFNGVFYLPPTNIKSSHDKNLIDKIENSANKKIYLTGWLFRNPVGIEKFREQIIRYFEPKRELAEKVNSFMLKLRKKYKKIVGVHIRQNNYRTFENGKFYFSPKEVKEIIKNYIEFSKEKDILFLICSDEKIDKADFGGLNVEFGPGHFILDLFALSKTDFIIGSNSTFGAFASYYGNIPMAVFDRNGMDWNYYKDKIKYFENKKCTTVCY